MIAAHAPCTSAPASGFAESGVPVNNTTGPLSSRVGRGVNRRRYTSVPGLSVAGAAPAMRIALACVSTTRCATV